MSAQTILIWLAVIWVGFTVIGSALHLIKLLLWVALLATIVVFVMGFTARGQGRGSGR